MTRKDYVLIAQILKQNSKDFIAGEDGFAVIQIIAKQLADALETDNPRFDRDRFLVACGVTSDLSQRMFTSKGELLN